MTDDEFFVQARTLQNSLGAGAKTADAKKTSGRPKGSEAKADSTWRVQARELVENRRGNARPPKEGAGSVETLIISPGTAPRRRSKLNKVLTPTSKNWFREGQPDSCWILGLES